VQRNAGRKSRREEKTGQTGWTEDIKDWSRRTVDGVFTVGERQAAMETVGA